MTTTDHVITPADMAMLKQLPEFQAALKAKEKRSAAEMQAAEKELASLTVQHDRQALKCNEDIAAALKVYQAAHAAHEAAIKALGMARQLGHAAEVDARQAQKPHREILLQHHADELEAFLEKLGDENERIARGVYKSESGTKFIMGIIPTADGVTDNSASIGRRTASIANAMREAHELAATKANITSDLQKLWDSLPALTMEAVQ